MRIAKRETTQTKIDLARDAIGKKLDWTPHIPIYRRFRFKGNSGPIKGMDTVPISNKFLCGQLGWLCQIMREQGITCPWREE